MGTWVPVSETYCVSLAILIKKSLRKSQILSRELCHCEMGGELAKEYWMSQNKEEENYSTRFPVDWPLSVLAAVTQQGSHIRAWGGQKTTCRDQLSPPPFGLWESKQAMRRSDKALHLLSRITIFFRPLALLEFHFQIPH